MRSAYIDIETRSILDVSLPGDFDDDEPNACYVHRINVPKEHRKKGIGRKLFDMLLEDADREGIVLLLQPNPYGEMGILDLIAWYKRLGFVIVNRHSLMMRREPR